jgi:hypothetical protein
MGAKAALTAGSIAAALLVLLAGCSMTPEALEANSEAASQNYADNYLEVYQRLADTARRCITGDNGPPFRATYLSMAVEAALHKELGFGEVRLWLPVWCPRTTSFRRKSKRWVRDPAFP